MAEWVCGSCSGSNPDGTSFCGHCGAKAPEARAPEERRLVTALFADISGFTPLADRLDPEELVEVVDPVVSALSSIVSRHEGFVEKFAGDALLALFGAPASHDDDAARALHVALEMHAEIERLKEDLPPDAHGLTLHVGVNSGHGIARLVGSEARTDYAVLGDAVILAQRLEAAAPAGETYLSETTLRLAEHRFEFEPVGELALKGRSDPVPAWRLVGERAASTRPARTPMVGRARELHVVTSALGSEDRCVVTVTGEPGVGKSRLVEEARVASEASGIRWLGGRCLSYGAAVPYWPLADLLRREDPRAAAADPFFARLLGSDSEATRTLEPEAYRHGLHAAFAAWLESLAPAVLVLEDVHWLDAASQALAGELCRRGSIPLLLTARPEAEPVLRELASTRTEVVLTPLGESGVEELVTEQLGAAPPRGLVGFVGRRAAGNPFFVQELVRVLQESGALHEQAGRWRLRSGWDVRELPPTIEELLAGRMDLLSRAAAATLHAASVIGRRVPLDLLAAVGGELSTVSELVRAAFLDEVDSAVVFRHALVQDAAYDRLLRRRRRDLHRRVAEAAEKLYGAGDDTIDLLARHLYLGGGGPKAVEYLLRAAERARGLHANEEAILHLGRCSELTPENMDLRLDLADLYELIGEYDRALALYEHVRDATADTSAWRGIAGVLRKRGEYAAALDAAASGLATAAGPDAAALEFERARTLNAAGRTEEAIEAAEAGLAAASGEPTAVVGRLLQLLARAETICGRPEAAVRHGAEARRIGEEVGDLHLQASSCRVLGDAHRLAGNHDEAATTLRDGLALAERVGTIEEIGGCLINLGLVELERGSVEAAIAYNRRAIEEFERVGHGSGRAIGYSNLAWALANAGRYDEALAAGTASLAFSREIGHLLTVAETLDTLSYVAFERGEYAKAIRLAEEAATLFVEQGADGDAAEALLRAAEASDTAGDAERAQSQRERALSLQTP